MFNLIRKDIVLQKKTLAASFLVLCVYLMLDISPIWVGVVFSIVISMYAFSIDEKSSIHILLNSLPYTRKEIVSSKYIVVVLLTSMVAAAILIVHFIIHRKFTIWKDILLMVAIVMTAASFMLPFCYKFKSNYLLIASIVAFGLYMLTVNFVVQNLNDQIREFVDMLLALHNTSLYLIVAISIITLYGCSWLLSIRIYRNKVF
ncbi:ABC-2 transporter permease [Bacillus paralicheniformis]|jgi:ABC-2 type transport system permease protein|uniref:ABC-2 transporter permease n=1 Tax=Bacillus paralicheniformis TaxID=1648923 RepID=UPI00034241D7|nr:ABC-2 transporter permease [Bacillus paralicheniformis]KJD56178.1 ABC transporter permease [Bacillus amyloliquefaciens]KUL09317.1 ABC transporter permease [Bacillus licheniformis LMG 7559]AGN34643.1 putative ABC transporter permease [Bacillus paralicheniformis ATCC 9945a]ARA84178.1 ABC transporter permease [Bacillus paralicheniformis]AYQ14795.1 ABC-2 transporter permease [Bacillus paralicheniformis]